MALVVSLTVLSPHHKSKWTFNKSDNVSYLKPVFKSGIVLGGKKRIHPTQKSLEIFEQIILVHTNPGDLIFDPFGGSFTTALAALNTKRSCISTEIDNNYYEKALQRFNGKFTTKLCGK